MNKKLPFTFFVAFWILFLEIIYSAFIFENLLSLDTLTVILFSIPWIVIVSLVCELFNDKLNRVFSISIISIITLITLAQIVYYFFYNSIFSFFSLTTGTGQVMHFWQAILEIIFRIWYIFVLVLVPFILFIVFNNKFLKYEKVNLKRFILLFSVFILSIISIFSLITFEKENVYSFKRLLFYTHAPIITVSKTGLYTMQAIDLYRYVFGFEENVYEDEDEEKVIIEPEIEYNALDIDFDSLLSQTNNKTLIKMHNYFNSIQPTEKNDYTGLFKGKNLIFVTAEAFDTIAIDERITPTLYKMANNGYVFTNFYQPLFPVSTSDGEYMNLTSLVPKEGIWSFKKSASKSMPFGMGTMFKNEGYTSYAFHNYTYNYYSRNKSHKNLGFTYYGCGNGLEKKMNCSHWPNSDYEMIKSTLSYYLKKDKPFATYYMTVSGHLNYNFYGNNMASRNKSKVSKLKYSDAIKAYYATQIEFDKAMEKLIKELDKAGKLNDTLIVISPDHYPYGLTKKQMNEVSDINRKNKFENYHTSLIIYNPTIEKTIVDKVVSSLDILPTIYNLYGLDFDSRLFMGSDVFSNTEGLVMLSDRSWITKKGTYNSVNNKFISKNNEEVSQEYVDSINKIVNKKFSMSSLILDNNYYEKLGLK